MSHKFLINTFTAWDEPPRARHQVTYALAKEHQVVFVARNKFGFRRKIELEQINDNITLINPIYPIDHRLRMRIPIMNEIYQRWLFRKLSKDYGTYLTINFDFTAHLIFRFFSPAIYYCNDECVGNTAYPNWFTDTYYKLCERKIIRKSSACIATSPYLTRKLLQYNPRTFEIPLGANSLQAGLTFKEERNKQSIKVCLMGNITQHQVPVELLMEIVAIDSFHLVLIGPTEEALIKKLGARENMSVTGVLKGQDLIKALSDIDIGLALYNKKKINPGTSPNKLWQYLSVGKPSIVTKLDNLDGKEFPPKSVYTHGDSDSLEDLIFQAFNEDTEDLFKLRRAFTADNTWDKRIELFLDVIENNT